MREFSVLDILDYYFKHFWIVLVFVLLMLGVGIFFTKNIFVATYRESTTIILGKSNNDGESEISSSTMTLYDSLIDNYLELLGSNKLLVNVKKDLELNYDIKSLSHMINYSTFGSSQMIQISVVNKNDKLAANICNGIVEELKKQVYDIYGIDNINVVDVAKASGKKVYSDLFIIVIFVFCGFICSSVAIILKFVFSDKIVLSRNKKEIMGINLIDIIVHRKIKKMKTLYRKLSCYEINKFRDVRSEFLFSINDNIKVVMISSIYKNDSRGYFVYNLANSLSNISKKILIIDIDLEDSKLSLEFNHDKYNIKGRGKSFLNFKFKRVDGVDMVFLNELSNSDVLVTSEFVGLIDKFKTQYDYIFIKSESFKQKFAIMSILSVCDGILFVDKKDNCKVSELNLIRDVIFKLNKVLIGIVFEKSNNSNKYYLSRDDLLKSKIKYKIRRRFLIAKKNIIRIKKFFINIKNNIISNKKVI